ncbi:hypothetical protein BHE74_00021247, partial [Ensete ventricosum]
MPRKGRKKTVKKSPLKPKDDGSAVPVTNGALDFEERQRTFNNREVAVVKKSLLETSSLQMPDFGLDEPSENQIRGRRDAFETPGATSNRLSFGMTPKTLRLPKNGEMLLSVHGSPLGVFKEESLAAIHVFSISWLSFIVNLQNLEMEVMKVLAEIR